MATKKKSTKPAKNVYDIVTEQIISMLEKGVIPWKKTWSGSSVGWIPRNAVTKKEYRGMNIFLLASMGYTNPYWLSFKQCSDLGGKVKKGERSSICVYWQITEKEELDPETKKMEKKKRFLLRYYNVFNVSQCEGLPEIYEEKIETRSKGEAIKSCEKLVRGYKAKPSIKHDSQQAYYHPTKDIVNMPKKESFDSSEAYYATLFHELVHSTGHVNRLGRKGIMDRTFFGSEDYSKEELIAEMGASFLCAFGGISPKTIDNSASYISNWMTALKGDSKLVVHAAGAAQKASDYIRGIQIEEVVNED